AATSPCEALFVLKKKEKRSGTKQQRFPVRLTSRMSCKWQQNPRNKNQLPTTSKGAIQWLEKVRQHLEFIRLERLWSTQSIHSKRLDIAIRISPFSFQKR